MTRTRRLAVTAMAASLTLLVGLVPAATAGAASPRATTAAPLPQLPQMSTGRQGALWLAGQFNSQGFIPTTPGGSTPDLSSTAQSILALSAANTDSALTQTALTYLESNVDAYVTQQGADGPGQLSLLMLDAEALGVNPASFGTTNLLARLLATQQTTGADAGLFGTEAQVTAYSAGNYQQGLALAALAGDGVTGTTQTKAAVAWLDAQQCTNGGWTSPDNGSLNSCAGTPDTSTGPDTNSTALAVQGLAAQGALTAAMSKSALTFFEAGQDADGGWSYFPNTQTTPGSTDPDSTALVIQGLLALGVSPTSATFVVGTASCTVTCSANPVSVLQSFQLTSGTDAGAFYFPPAPSPASLLATYQAVPALAALSFPFGQGGQSYWLTASDGGIFSFGNGATFLGSMGGTPLNKPVVGMASTPDGQGYWEVASDGGIFSFGDAAFYGSMGGTPLNKPVVGIASTPDGQGYWEVASDGGIFSFGDAAFYGSMGGTALNKPVVGIASTPDGKGYWEVASDGGIFSFGDATFYGSMGSKILNKPVVGIASTPDGQGYWEVASDGGIFSFGDATFYGSMGSKVLNKPVVGIASTPDGQGYWEVASDGGIFTFGDAPFAGSTGGVALNQPVVGIAASGARPASGAGAIAVTAPAPAA